MGNEDFKINSALNDIRKIMDNILPNYTKLVSVLNKSKGMQCNDRKNKLCSILYLYIQKSLHSCVAITNPGSHRTETDKDVTTDRSPYLIRSLIYEMLNYSIGVIFFLVQNLPYNKGCSITSKSKV